MVDEFQVSKRIDEIIHWDDDENHRYSALDQQDCNEIAHLFYERRQDSKFKSRDDEDLLDETIEDYYCKMMEDHYDDQKKLINLITNNKLTDDEVTKLMSTYGIGE